MNYLKKLLGYIVTMAMVFTLTGVGIGAVHAENTTYTITLTGTATGHTYEAYQIFTGDLKTNDNGEKVLSNVKWGTGVTYSGTKSAADVAKALGEKENIENKMTIDQLIDKLTLTTPVKTVASSTDSTSTVIDKLAAGYYLLKDKDGTQANTSDAYTKFIVQVVGNSEVEVKSDVPTVEKKVKDKYDTDGTTSEWQDSADYDINDEIPYQITGTMPDNIADYTTYQYLFTDTMSKGLTFKNGSAKIMIGDKDVTSSFTEAVSTQENGPTVVTWTCDNLKGINNVTLDANTTVVVTYNAKLNENAVIGSAGNDNKVNLTYSNNPNKGGEGETGKTPDDKNIVFTYKAVVNKVDKDSNPLKGAGFTLQKEYKKEDGTTEYRDVKKIEAGDTTTFEFTGLDDGNYKLIESTTPAGYNTIDPIKFTISATHEEKSDDPKLLTLSGDVISGEATFTAVKDAGSLTTDVVNKPGSQLPETGGMGTTVLYVLGGVLVALAAAYVIYTKKHEKA